MKISNINASVSYEKDGKKSARMITGEAMVILTANNEISGINHEAIILGELDACLAFSLIKTLKEKMPQDIINKLDPASKLFYDLLEAINDNKDLTEEEMDKFTEGAIHYLENHKNKQ